MKAPAAADPEPQSEPASPSPRRPYEPPAVVWQEEWDVRANLAAACAKRTGDSDGCNLDNAS